MTHGRVRVTVLVCLPPDTLGQFPVHRIRPEFVRHTDDVLLSQLHSLIEHLFHEFEGICTVVVPFPTLDYYKPAVPPTDNRHNERLGRPIPPYQVRREGSNA